MITEASPQTRGRRAVAAMFICSALTALVMVMFFVIGIDNGSVSSSNLVYWLAPLVVTGLSLWGGYALSRRGKFGFAIASLAVTAVPGVLAAVLFIYVLIHPPRFN